jgi:uncharacterized FAD-dependent dehydrogenase
MISLEDRIANDKKRRAVEENQKQVRAFVAVLHHKDDFESVPRMQMANTLALYHAKINHMLVELFCANPNHLIFKTAGEEVLAPLRVERVIRISGGKNNGKEFIQGDPL